MRICIYTLPVYLCGNYSDRSIRTLVISTVKIVLRKRWLLPLLLVSEDVLCWVSASFSLSTMGSTVWWIIHYVASSLLCGRMPTGTPLHRRQQRAFLTCVCDLPDDLRGAQRGMPRTPMTAAAVMAFGDTVAHITTEEFREVRLLVCSFDYFVRIYRGRKGTGKESLLHVGSRPKETVPWSNLQLCAGHR